MSQDIIVVAGLFAVLAGIWVVNMVSRKNRMGCIQAMLKEEWGSGHPKEYTYEEFEWISHYYKNRQDKSIFVFSMVPVSPFVICDAS